MADPQRKFIVSLRTLLSVTFATNGTKKSASTEKLIGCSLEFISSRFEDIFDEGMTWENYGRNGWHIEHIRPCNSFDAGKKEQHKVMFNWRNLRPFWENDNLAKGDKYSVDDEAAWIRHMRELGYNGELFPIYE